MLAFSLFGSPLPMMLCFESTSLGRLAFRSAGNEVIFQVDGNVLSVTTGSFFFWEEESTFPRVKHVVPSSENAWRKTCLVAILVTILKIWEPEHICWHEIKYLHFSFLLKKMAAVAVYCGQTRVLGSMASQKSRWPSFYGDLSRLRCVGVDQLPLWIPMVGMVINL